MPKYLPELAALTAIIIMCLGLWWFLYHYMNRVARQVYTEDNPMDHKDLELIMKSGQHDVRLTTTQAGELLAEFNRIKMHLNDALERKTQLHIELEEVKRVANDQSLLISQLDFIGDKPVI